MARCERVCYKVLALVTFVLSIGALACAGVGYGRYRDASTDLPFYVGGLIVAPLALVAVGLALVKSCQEPNYVPTCCDKCLAKTWWLVVGFLVAGCIVGIVFVSVGGLSGDQTNTDVRAISVVMMICFVCLIVIWALATCLNWCCNKTPSIKVSDHRPARDLDHSVSQSSRSSNPPAANITIINSDTSQHQIADLKRQNRLMKQQINQQQQLITQQLEAHGTLMEGLRQQQQQQQQQHQQQQYPDGEQPPPYKSVV